MAALQEGTHTKRLCTIYVRYKVENFKINELE